ncbi:MAG: phosphatase PAP2 family protein [bacterium]
MNETIFFFFYNLAHKSQIFDSIVVFFADTFPYIVIILAGLFLLFHHEVLKAEEPFRVFMEKKKEILLAFFSGGLAWVLAAILKYIIHTPRPFNAFANIQPLISETSFAFPSGHATFFMALAISLLFYHKRVGYIFIFFALLIGIARIIAGVHFPVDILGGFILGALVAYFIKKVS